MSVEVLLIPIGIAVAAAWRESRSTELCRKCKSTRIADQRLLVEALQVLGAGNILQESGRVTATTSFGPATFRRVGEIFLGRIDDNESATESMLAELERSVGRVLQARSIAVVRQRAHELGLNLVTERSADGSVELVFEESR